jgi:hypothetical protein
MSGTARGLLTWAATQVGTLEQPIGSNKQPFAGMAGHTNGLAWCATFLVAGWKANGVALVAGTDTAWTPGMRAAFRTTGRLHDEPRPGDHVESIEGNTNRDGSRTGIGVFRGRRRWRNGGSIRGFGRPLYDQPPSVSTVDLSNVIHAARNDPAGPQGATSFPADVRIVEAALMAEGLLSASFAKDGSFGKLTVAAFSQWQRVCGFTGDDADGIPDRRSLTQLGLRHGFRVQE